MAREHKHTQARVPGLAMRVEVSPEGGNQWPPILEGKRGGSKGTDRAIERNDPVAVDPRICVRGVEVTERLLQHTAKRAAVPMCWSKGWHQSQDCEVRVLII